MHAVTRPIADRADPPPRPPVPQEHTLNLDRRDILSPTDDHVLQTIADFDITIRMDDRSVASMKPAPLKGTRRSFGVVVIALHDDIAACHNFTECRPIVRDLVALFIDYQ